MKKVAINGFGRIGRLVFRLICDDLDVVAINDLGSAEDLAYLLKYDSNHRTFKKEISFEDDYLIVNNKKIKVISEKDPSNLPWKEMGVDLVLECTGLFTSLEKANKHIEAGAKKVLVSAPCKGDVKTIVYGVNHNILDGSETVISAASCTTNCLAPVLNVLNNNIGVVKGFMTTVHAFTGDQVLLDVAHKKGIYSRRGRAASMNIVPSSTGAASAIGKVIPSLEGKMSGSALRVPVSTGSIVDLTLELSRNTTKEEINHLFDINKSDSITITYDPIVSSDVISNEFGSIVDGLLTEILEVDGKQLVKVVSWYDNEYSYSAQMARTIRHILNNL